jgi:hypothetical protein
MMDTLLLVMLAQALVGTYHVQFIMQTFPEQQWSKGSLHKAMRALLWFLLWAECQKSK